MMKVFTSSLVLFVVLFGTIESASAETIWHDASNLKIEGKGWDTNIQQYRRLPKSCKDKVPGSVWKLSRHSAGLNILFSTDSQEISIRWTLINAGLSMKHMPATGVSGIDLYTKNDKGQWRFVANARPVGKTSNCVINTKDITGVNRDYKIYLPLYNGIEKLEIGISSDMQFDQPKMVKRKQVVYYGTSIAQGACASRPGMAFTSILERKLGCELVNLGFSGSGKMEPVMADVLTEIDADVFVIDCLWNIPNSKHELIEERVINLTKTLRKTHPDTPILFVGQSHFKKPWPSTISKVQENAVSKLLADGFKDVHILSGEKLIGDDGEGTVDGCHPNDLGMMRQADAIMPKLKMLLNKKP